MEDLTSLLNSVAKGKTSVDKAKVLIEKTYAPKKATETNETPIEGLKTTFEKLRKTMNIEEIFKISSGVLHQISENIPQLEKISGNLAQNLQPFGFSSNVSGIESKLSVFRSFNVSTDSVVKDNLVVGSQWFGVTFSANAIVKNNKFTAVQFSEFTVTRSDFCFSQFSLSRLSNMTVQESRVENNKFTRTNLSDISITESDFTENTIAKSDFSETVINASRLTRLTFLSSEFKDCEFDSCDLQGLEFENCKFKECIFSKIHLTLKEPVKISGRNLTGKNISDCNSTEEFLNLLNQ